MCYKKPGPRCSAHASNAFKRAQNDFNDNPSLENYERQRAAADAFYGTPAGFKALEDKIANESDEGIQNTLSLYLELKRLERKEAIRKINSQKENTPAGSTILRLRGDMHVETVLDKPFIEGPPLHTEGAGLIVQYDYHSGTAKVTHYDTRNFLAEMYQVSPHSITDDMVQELDNFKPLDHMTAVSNYGDVYVNYSQELTDKVSSIFYNQEHAGTWTGELEFLRGQGVVTKGKDPLTATVDFLRQERSFPEDVDARISKATYVNRVFNVNLSDITVDEERYNEATSSNASEGVIIPNGGGSGYTLLYGENYIKANKESGYLYADFLVLEGRELD